jgi:hypothetical protein
MSAAHNDGQVFRERDLGPVDGFTSSALAEGVTVTGICPQCGGETTMSFSYGYPRAGTLERRPVPRGEGGPPDQTAETPTTLYCACGSTHAGRPESSEETGCGAYWTVYL